MTISFALQNLRRSMSTFTPGLTAFFLCNRSQELAEEPWRPRNVLYFLEKLSGRARTLVGLCRLLRLEMSLQPLRVLGRSGGFIVRRHLGTVGERTHIEAEFIQVKAVAM